MVLVPVSTSFNTGYRLDTTKSNQGRQDKGAKPTPPEEHWGAWTLGGKAPTLVVRVGLTVRGDAINGMSYTFRDFYMKDIGGGTVSYGVLKVPADREVWFVELTRK